VQAILISQNQLHQARVINLPMLLDDMIAILFSPGMHSVSITFALVWLSASLVLSNSCFIV
jgi:hypothetical protein